MSENESARNKELRAEVEALRKQNTALKNELRDATLAANDDRTNNTLTLPEVIEALRKDAERYRWLRTKLDANTNEDWLELTDAMSADDPDAAIDAALSGEA